MPLYLFQGTYTAEAWQILVKKPQNRVEVVRQTVEKLGGKVVGGWLAFGESDIVLLVELPDEVSAAAFGITAAAGGALRAQKTTLLMSPEEGLEAMKKAGKSGYRPPAAR